MSGERPEELPWHFHRENPERMGAASQIFVDLQVFDLIRRVHRGDYIGASKEELDAFFRAAVSGKFIVWISEISPVELAIGREKVAHLREKHAKVQADDSRLLGVIQQMHARTLTYPASKLDDSYSRVDVSFRCAGPSWDEATELEQTLRAIDERISAGDAPQLISLLCGVSAVDLETHPPIRYLVTEDRKFRSALRELERELPQLAGIEAVSVTEFLAQLGTTPFSQP